MITPGVLTIAIICITIIILCSINGYTNTKISAYKRACDRIGIIFLSKKIYSYSDMQDLHKMDKSDLEDIIYKIKTIV